MLRSVACACKSAPRARTRTKEHIGCKSAPRARTRKKGTHRLRVRASRRHVRAPEQRNTSVARAEVACQSVPHARVRVFSLLYVHIHTRTRTQTCAHTGMRKHVGVARAEAARKLLHDAVDLLRLARQPELGQKNSIARNILE